MSTKQLTIRELMVDGHVVEVRSSARRRRSVQAYRDGERIVVLLPARLSRREADEWTAKMVARVVSKEVHPPRVKASDSELAARAAELSKQYLDGRARPSSVRWVTNQNSRWGSCTPSHGTIRLSHRLQSMPSWVVDYVLMHELTHLLIAPHNAKFWAMVERYPRTERARGYLEGVSAGPGLVRRWEGDESASADGDEGLDGDLDDTDM